MDSRGAFIRKLFPITAWVPLPPEMQTEPGERRVLYMDAALSDGLTINAPISPLGLDAMQGMIGMLTETYGVAFTLSNPPQDSLAFIAARFSRRRAFSSRISPRPGMVPSNPLDPRGQRIYEGSSEKVSVLWTGLCLP